MFKTLLKYYMAKWTISLYIEDFKRKYNISEERWERLRSRKNGMRMFTNYLLTMEMSKRAINIPSLRIDWDNED